MKYIIPMILLSLSNFASASTLCTEEYGMRSTVDLHIIDTRVPKNLEGAVIVVKTKDGKEFTMLARDFKVVPRKQQFITKETVIISTVSCLETKEIQADVIRQSKNRVSLLGGTGPTGGFDVSRSGNQITIENKSVVVGGVQYQRVVKKRVSVGAQIQTNKTGLVSIGLDF